jgi:Rho GTPase-activating protein 39
MKVERNKGSPATSGHSVNNIRTIQQINQLLKPNNTLKSPSSHYSQDISVNSIGKINKSSLRSNKDQQTLDRKMPAGSSSSMGKGRKNMYTMNSNHEMEYENGNMSPLYTNWDQDMHEHLLPLQHYILEQAKLSGYHDRSQELYDSDSIHSESHSEHSISDHETGHEPDNEDSDNSDGHGDYLVHNPYEDYGAFRGPSYYNYEQNFNRNMSREDM